MQTLTFVVAVTFELYYCNPNFVQMQLNITSISLHFFLLNLNFINLLLCFLLCPRILICTSNCNANTCDCTFLTAATAFWWVLSRILTLQPVIAMQYMQLQFLTAAIVFWLGSIMNMMPASQTILMEICLMLLSLSVFPYIVKFFSYTR